MVRIRLDDLSSLINVYNRVAGDEALEILDVDLDKLGKNLSKIIRELGINEDSDLVRFVNALLENKEEIRNALLGRNERLNNILSEYFESKLRNQEYEANWGILADIIPVRVFVVDAPLRIFMVYKPTREELKLVSRPVSTTIELNKLLEIVPRYDPKEKTIKIGNRVFRFSNEEEFARAISLLGYKRYREYIKQRLDDALPFNVVTELGSGDDVHLVLDPSKENIEFPMKAVSEMKIHLYLHRYPEVYGTIEFKGDVFHDEVSIETDIDNLRDTILRKIEDEKKLVEKKSDMLAELRELVRQGYEINKFTEYEKGKWISVVELARKEDNLVERIAIPFRRNTGRVTVVIGNPDVPLEIIENELKKRGLNPLEYIVRYGLDYTEISRVVKFKDIDDLLKESELMKDIARKSVNTYLNRMRRLRKEKISETKYITVYLLEAAGVYTDPVVLIGRKRKGVYSLIGKILKSINPDLQNELRKYYDSPMIEARDLIIDELIVSKYIELNEKGEVIVGGEPLEKILREMEVPEDKLPKILESVKGYVLSRIIAINGKLPKRYRTPEIVRILIENNVYIPEPEVLATDYNGKPLWGLLDDDIRMKIIKAMSPVHIYESLTKYRDVFGKDELRLVKELLEKDWNLGTLYLVNHRPETITDEKHDIEIKSVNPEDIRSIRFVAVKIPPYLAQVVSINDLSPRSAKKFAVFREDSTFGVFVYARGVDEAVEKVSQVYDDIDELLYEVENLHIRGAPIALSPVRTSGFFALYEVIDRESDRRIEVSYENTEEIKSIIEKYKIDNRMLLDQ